DTRVWDLQDPAAQDAHGPQPAHRRPGGSRGAPRPGVQAQQGVARDGRGGEREGDALTRVFTLSRRPGLTVWAALFCTGYLSLTPLAELIHVLRLLALSSAGPCSAQTVNITAS